MVRAAPHQQDMSGVAQPSTAPWWEGIDLVHSNRRDPHLVEDGQQNSILVALGITPENAFQHRDDLQEIPRTADAETAVSEARSTPEFLQHVPVGFIINGNNSSGARSGIFSDDSLLVCDLQQKHNSAAKAITIYHIAGRHANDNGDHFYGVKGMLRSLILQIILSGAITRGTNMDRYVNGFDFAHASNPELSALLFLFERLILAINVQSQISMSRYRITVVIDGFHFFEGWSRRLSAEARAFLETLRHMVYDSSRHGEIWSGLLLQYVLIHPEQMFAREPELVSSAEQTINLTGI